MSKKGFGSLPTETIANTEQAKAGKNKRDMITIETNRLNAEKTAFVKSEDNKPYVLFSTGGRWVRSWMKDTLRIQSPDHRTINGKNFVWVVPKSKKNLLVAEALKIDSHVVVFRAFKASTTCVDSCKVAIKPEIECECSCLGRYHGLVPVGKDNATDSDKEEAKALAGNIAKTLTDVVPDAELHIHNKYLEVSFEYRDGELIRKAIRNVDGVYREVPLDYVWNSLR